MRQVYTHKTFRSEALRLIDTINEIVEDYQAQGFRLTVRQLYYQLVTRNTISNTLQEYKRIAGIINDAKLAGLIDWEAFQDITREFSRQQRWESGAQILKAAVDSFHKDMWVNQDYRVFVIVEKDALKGVLTPTCRKFDTPLLAARGYPSGTVIREFVESDIIDCIDEGKEPIVLHLGDHDPSGIDMSRDLKKRIALFAGQPVEVRRIALTMDQIREQRPPENPAKVTDSRAKAYMKEHGKKSWELDALSPAYLANLLTTHIEQFIDWSGWGEVASEVHETKRRIIELSEGFA